jgi:hypothetical protein
MAFADPLGGVFVVGVAGDMIFFVNETDMPTGFSQFSRHHTACETSADYKSKILHG